MFGTGDYLSASVSLVEKAQALNRIRADILYCVELSGPVKFQLWVFTETEIE